VDDLLSKELMKLSFQDRNKINEEMHGVRCLAPPETPQMLRQALEELQMQLTKTYYKPSYDQAQQLFLQQQQAKGGDNRPVTTCYVNTEEFRLKFLRCEFFDIEAAATRLLNYLELLVELYGPYALTREIQLSDFTKQEIQILRAGYQQLWPFRDRSGRRILSIVGNLAMEFDPTLRAKAYFYFWMIASNDIESQQKGVVFLVWPTLDTNNQNQNQNTTTTTSSSTSSSGSRDRDRDCDCDRRGHNSTATSTSTASTSTSISTSTSTSTTVSNKSKSNSFLKQTIPSDTDIKLHVKMNAAAPIRFCAIHFCYPNRPFFHVLRSVMSMTLGISAMSRLKFHVGEGIELQYILKGYGIPIENLPITDTGNIKTTYLKQWLRIRKIIEVELTPSGQSTSGLSIIECPRSVDVIFRPGTSMFSHPGNVTFRGLIESKAHNRIATKRSDKEKVALEIIREVQQLGGRFLNWVPTIGYWTDISNQVPICVDKIVVSYRDYKKKVRNHLTATATAANNANAATATATTTTTTTTMVTTNINSGKSGNGSTKNGSNHGKEESVISASPLHTTTTATTSLDCSTYAFLGQQSSSYGKNNKRKRTGAANANNARDCFLFS